MDRRIFFDDRVSIVIGGNRGGFRRGLRAGFGWGYDYGFDDGYGEGYEDGFIDGVRFRPISTPIRRSDPLSRQRPVQRTGRCGGGGFI